MNQSCFKVSVTNRKENEDQQNSVVTCGDNKKVLEENAPENFQFYEECRHVYRWSKALVSNLKAVLIQIQEKFQVEESFTESIHLLGEVIEKMKKITSLKISMTNKEIENHRMSLWKTRLSVEKLAITKVATDLVVHLLDSALGEAALRLADLCNEILRVKLSGDFKSINVFSNACPILLQPFRKLSMRKILQILAARRAEMCGFHLMFKLLENYYEYESERGLDSCRAVEDDVLLKLKENKGPIEDQLTTNQKLLVSQNSVSSNTSIEIYRALTKHLEKKAKEDEKEGENSMDGLWGREEKRARALLALSARTAPRLLGNRLMASSKTSGLTKLKTVEKMKLIDYYQEILWGEVGGYLEHILLWWNPDPLGCFPPPLTLSLKDYIVHLYKKDTFPSVLSPSVSSLLDAMCCHLTSTSWDQLFRKTLVSAGNARCDIFKNYEIAGSATGQLFDEMLTDLIKLNNNCENKYLTLEELSLFEQIPILHRLDHSVHTVRLWSFNKCRNLAAKWNLNEFYCTFHTDITKCLHALSALQLQNHEVIPVTTSVQAVVCIKMRAKLVSEIHENIEKLKKTASECINVLAKNCRTHCLAVLHMFFPDPKYWKQNGPLPDCASDYVEKYLDSVLRPVFVATHKMSSEIQHSSSAMVLRILCESWLEYVYLLRIKFSERGAVQLLTDFGAIPTWLLERVQLPKDLLTSLISHEVLRRCEGVGRLLLRRRGESIKMSAPNLYKKTDEDVSADNMPAEMYVPNQEQWLDLRAPLKTNICSQI